MYKMSIVINITVFLLNSSYYLLHSIFCDEILEFLFLINVELKVLYHKQVGMGLRN